MNTLNGKPITCQQDSELQSRIFSVLRLRPLPYRALCAVLKRDGFCEEAAWIATRRALAAGTVHLHAAPGLCRIDGLSVNARRYLAHELSADLPRALAMFDTPALCLALEPFYKIWTPPAIPARAWR